jgi:hypothetical protein
MLAKGFGIGVDLGAGLRTVGDLGAMTVKLRDITPSVINAGKFRDVLGDAGIATHLQAVLDGSAEQLMSNVLANEIAVDPVLGTNVVRTPNIGVVIAPGGIDTGIVGLPGGILDIGHVAPVIGPHDQPPPRRARRPKAKAPDRPDPLDEVLVSRARRPRKDRT